MTPSAVPVENHTSTTSQVLKTAKNEHSAADLQAKSAESSAMIRTKSITLTDQEDDGLDAERMFVIDRSDLLINASRC